MRLLLDDVLATAPFVVPLTAGWCPEPSPDVEVQARPGLTADAIGPDDTALVAAGELPFLQESHRVAPDAAFVFGEVGTVAMRCPVRPDEIETTPVRFWNASGTGRYLARATLQPFYGIKPSRWSDDEDPDAQVVIVEGAEALRPVEAGFAEDLCRAWFILTGEAVVGHALVVPKATERGDLAPVLASLDALRAAGNDRRRELRQAIAATHDLSAERVQAFVGRMRLTLEPGDRRSLLMLLQRGHPGGETPYVRGLEYLEPAE